MISMYDPTITANAMEAQRKRLEDERKNQNTDFQNQVNLVKSGGYNMTPDMVRRAGDTNYGLALGQREFFDNPDMQRLRQLREQYAKGYSGEELGAIRQTARGEIAGRQQAQQRNLASNLSKQGVGGARAAAILGAQGLQGAKTVAEAERKMALDSANIKRQEASNLQDYILRQQYGKLGTGLGMASLGSADFAAQQAAAANQPGKKKNPIQSLLDMSFLGSEGIFSGL